MSGLVRSFDRLEDLPGTARALLDRAGQARFHLDPLWWACMQAHALPEGGRARYLVSGADDAVLPLWAGPGRALGGLENHYSVIYEPIFAERLGQPRLRAIGAEFGGAIRRAGTIRLDALDGEATWLPPVLAGLREAGLSAQLFDHFGNWWEPVAGRGWEAYLADRPRRQRETVRRRLARAGRDPSISIQRVTGGAELEDAIAAYCAVYARSWKEPEPYPDFNPAVIRAAAAASRLRLWLLRRDGQPVAAQYWVLAAEGAMVLKLAHDEAHKAISPGTVLTAHAVRDLLENDRVPALDFGRGDDPYKADWCTRRRQRIGVLLCDPRSAAGALAIARHGLGRLRAGLARSRAGLTHQP